MTKQEMVAEVEKMHRSRPGYAFDSAKIAKAIDAGIPDGATLTIRGDQVVKHEAGDMVVYVEGVETNRVTMDAQQAERALMAYAFGVSKQGAAMGAM